MAGVGVAIGTNVMAGHASRLKTPLFRVPPFPHARERSLLRPGSPHTSAVSDRQLDELMELTARRRVGGTFWGKQPQLPDNPYTLVRIRDEAERSSLLESLGADCTVLIWLDSAAHMSGREEGLDPHTAIGCCDPWHLLSRAEKVCADADDELTLIGALAGLPIQAVGEGPFRGLNDANGDRSACRQAFRAAILEPSCFVSPFSGRRISPSEAIEFCSHWRHLIDSNRRLSGAIGFAGWKRSTVAPLLWNGSGQVPFVSRPANPDDGKAYAVWKSRVSARNLAELERGGHQLVEVEDGFIRSVGLGADCVPPLSIVVDDLGIYFDPNRQSDLERLLQNGCISEDMIGRARRLRQLIVERGVGKYGSAGPTSERGVRAGSILVPGQVEGDRSIICGGGEVRTNLDLLRRVRADAPDAHIIYKPHPDVEAGHRSGNIPDRTCLTIANEIVRDRPISALFDEVGAIHVNTSLAGFEALLRGKPVTTFGVPFYAGWGLTRDLGPVPVRRGVKRTLDELVAAALLIYPRYIDPVTGIPCPPEVLLERLSQAPEPPGTGLLVPMRRLQGRLKRVLTSFRSVLA